MRPPKDKEDSAPSSPEARRVLRRWVDSVNAGKSADVAGLYAGDCTLLPTLSSDICRTPAQIESYFKQLAEQGGLRVVLDEDSVAVRVLGDGCCALSGRYVFQIGAGDTSSVYPARFTFIVDVARERPILHHHSSRTP